MDNTIYQLLVVLLQQIIARCIASFDGINVPVAVLLDEIESNTYDD
jgi:hypothetical protein